MLCINFSFWFTLHLVPDRIYRDSQICYDTVSTRHSILRTSNFIFHLFLVPIPTPSHPQLASRTITEKAILGSDGLQSGCKSPLPPWEHPIENTGRLSLSMLFSLSTLHHLICWLKYKEEKTPHHFPLQQWLACFLRTGKMSKSAVLGMYPKSLIGLVF